MENSRIFRFILENSILDPETLQIEKVFVLKKTQENEIFLQLKTVLRSRIGDRVVLLNKITVDNPVKAYEFHFSLVEINHEELVLELFDLKENCNELPAKLELAFCLPNKPNKLDLVLQKATELRASKIHLIESDFTQFKHQLKSERLQKILIEAVEQSERGKIPIIEHIKDFPNFINENAADIFIALERANSKPALQMKPAAKNVILIGPEGGFSEAEKQQIEQLELHTFSLGNNILRNETAAIVALGIFSLKLENS